MSSPSYHPNIPFFSATVLCIDATVHIHLIKMQHKVDSWRPRFLLFKFCQFSHHKKKTGIELSETNHCHIIKGGEAKTILQFWKDVLGYKCAMGLQKKLCPAKM